MLASQMRVTTTTKKKKHKVKYASIGSHMRTQVNTILKELPAE